MVKKSDKYAGMADMFEQLNTEQLIAQKTADFNAARAELEAQIRSIEKSASKYDSGLGDIEDRNEINGLRNEIRFLEQRYNQEIAKLKSQQK